MFFGSLASSNGDWSSSISSGLVVTVGLVVLALLVGVADLVVGRLAARRRSVPDEAPSPAAEDADGPAVMGRVVRVEDGEPVPGAILTLVDEGGHQAARTDGESDGGYRLAVPGPGSYQLVARASGRAPEVGRVVVGAHGSTYDVVLAPSAAEHALLH